MLDNIHSVLETSPASISRHKVEMDLRLVEIDMTYARLLIRNEETKWNEHG